MSKRAKAGIRIYPSPIKLVASAWGFTLCEEKEEKELDHSQRPEDDLDNKWFLGFMVAIGILGILGIILVWFVF